MAVCLIRCPKIIRYRVKDFRFQGTGHYLFLKSSFNESLLSLQFLLTYAMKELRVASEKADRIIVCFHRCLLFERKGNTVRCNSATGFPPAILLQWQLPYLHHKNN